MGTTAAAIDSTGLVVPIPGRADGAVVHCRIPELAVLYGDALLPVPLVAAVVAAHPLEADDEPRWVIDEVDTARDYEDWLDGWVIAATFAPRIVRTPNEESSTALWIGHLQASLKAAIYHATYPMVAQRMVARGAALTTFRRRQRQRADPRPDGAPVRAAAVSAPRSKRCAHGHRLRYRGRAPRRAA